MKVILTEDIKGKGKAGDIIEVADVYGRNAVINKGLGVEATAANLNSLKLKNKHEEKLEAERVTKALNIKSVIDNFELKIEVKKGKDGKLFGSVTSKEISEALKKKFNIDIDKKDIKLKTAIKEIGETVVKIRLHKDVTAEVKVKVE